MVSTVAERSFTVRQLADEADEHYPRDEQNRYRIYRLRRCRLEVMVTMPTPEGIGLALVTLTDEGEFDSYDAVGVLDTHGRRDIAGTWIVNPYATGQ